MQLYSSSASLPNHNVKFDKFPFQVKVVECTLRNRSKENLMNDAFFFEVDADCRYEFVFKGSVGVLIKQGSFTDARISEAQEFDEIIVVG